MKKVLAVILALVMAFSCSALAFAEDADDAAPAVDAAEVLTFVQGMLDRIVTVVKSETSQWDAIESIVLRIIDFVEDLLNGVIGADANVKGALADLEGFLADKGIISEKVQNFINDIKAKIKSFYAGEKATVVETEAEAPAETGSTSVGIAAFAAVSVAAAAAYVCTKKRA